jgi:hypothetical protein
MKRFLQIKKQRRNPKRIISIINQKRIKIIKNRTKDTLATKKTMKKRVKRNMKVRMRARMQKDAKMKNITIKRKMMMKNIIKKHSKNTQKSIIQKTKKNVMIWKKNRKRTKSRKKFMIRCTIRMRR